MNDTDKSHVTENDTQMYRLCVWVYVVDRKLSPVFEGEHSMRVKNIRTSLCLVLTRKLKSLTFRAVMKLAVILK